MWAAWIITLILAAGVTLAVIVVGRRFRIIGRATLVALSVLVAAWIIGDRLQASGWHDIDGWVDRNKSCGLWHLVGALSFWAPPAIGIVLIIAVLIAATIDRDRFRRRS